MGEVNIKKREGSTVVLLVNVSWPPQLRRPQGRAEAAPAPPLQLRATEGGSPELEKMRTSGKTLWTQLCVLKPYHQVVMRVFL